MSGRVGTLSPVSAEGSEWSGIAKYQQAPQRSDPPYSPSNPNFRSGALATPPVSSASSGTMNGNYPPPGRRPSDSPGNPSPPSSIARSSDGAGLYASSDSGQSRKAMIMEESLLDHYVCLKRFLAATIRQDNAGARPNRARDKLLRLSPVQFQELSTDVYDELVRRQNTASYSRTGGPPQGGPPPYLMPRDNFHPKRNQARQKLSSLPPPRFKDLATDVYYELERRFPRFSGGDIDRVGSPAMSMRSGRGPSGPPMRGMGPPRNNGYPASPGLGPSGPPNEYGRPLPKTFQSNTLVPNKSTLVEYDDDQPGPDDDPNGDPYGLGARLGKRNTDRSTGAFENDKKLFVEYQTQVGELREKVDSLEHRLRDKDAEVAELREAEKSRDSTINAEREKWSDLRSSLEHKVAEAVNLNDNLQSELERVRAESANMERDMRNQLDNAHKGANNSGNEWKERYLALERDHKELKIDLREQQQVTEEVRKDAATWLAEMKILTDRSDEAWEREEQRAHEVERLEEELKEWKSRYARTKTQVRSLRASSVGLASQLPDARDLAKNGGFASLEGLVKDVHVTKFQIAIDELLRVARNGEFQLVIEHMKAVVATVRHITQDIGDEPTDEHEEASQRTKLKIRVSATANNLITASKNYASSHGISPVSLLDAAASHLTASIIELVRAVKIRPTPGSDLEEEKDDTLSRLPPGETPSYLPIRPGRVSAESSYSFDLPSRDSSHSHVGAGSRWTSRSRGSTEMLTNGKAPGGNKLGYGQKQQDGELEELKIYLEDQTEGLVQSIQALVASIRAEDGVSLVCNHLEEIAAVVAKVVSSTDSAINQTTNAALRDALRDRGEPILEKLSHCRDRVLDASAEGERIRDPKTLKEFSMKLPPLAFEIARETKELVQRIDQVDHDLDDADNDNFR
ncbi:MAG: hypothetical protein M1825_002974 [Sarcosagium campestre]|nr:MAG: hypothetical protein M1825_002974 [Sarcosagium campestre]